jgi:hypothetical protein
MRDILQYFDLIVGTIESSAAETVELDSATSLNASIRA